MVKKALLKLRYFLWVLSGSDLKILKESPTDYNRHANIGLAIFVTTLIAFFTGALAGYEFGNKTIFSAILFGVIWSLLVFTIDRTMVLTLKKNPSSTSKERLKKLIIPVIYRVFLSALISFFISIPLELWLFRENIKVQLDIDKNEEIISKQKREESVYNISDIEKSVTNLENKSRVIDSLHIQVEPPSNYKNYSGLKQETKDAKQSLKNLQNKYSRMVKNRKIEWSKIPIYYFSSDTLRIHPQQNTKSNTYRKWYTLWGETKPNSGTLTKQLQSKKTEFEDLKERLKSVSNEYFVSISNKKLKLDSLKTKTEATLEKNKSDVEDNTNIFAEIIKSQEGFTTKWVAINNIDDFWIIFFIWFIRLLFFTIEMLPTMAKVTTPVGSYDWGVYRAERRRRNYLKEVEELEVEKLVEIEKQKLKIELKTQKIILNKLAEKQNKIAISIIDDWEKIQKEKSKKEIKKFIDKYD